MVSVSQQGTKTVLFGLVIRPKLHWLLVKYVQKGEEKTQTLFYDLEMDVVNWITVVFADERLWMYVNCNRIYERPVGTVDTEIPGSSKYDVKFASKPNNVRLVNATLRSGFEVNTWKQECYQTLFPEILSAGNSKLQENQDMKQQLLSYQHQLSKAQLLQQTLTAELKKWDGCECHRPCWHEGQKKADSSTWKSGGKQCKCSEGKIHCSCISPPVCLSSQSLIRVNGSVCPKCFHRCKLSRSSYSMFDHGSWGTNKVTSQRCLCQDGSWTSCQNVATSTIVCDTCLNHSACFHEGYYNCRCQSNGYDGAVVCNQTCNPNSLLHPTVGKCIPAWKIKLHYSDKQEYTKALKSRS